jgi:fucose permease
MQPQSNQRRGVWLSILLSYAAMMALSVAINLTPLFLTTLSTDLGGAAGLTLEQLGRIGATTVAGALVAIVVSGALADRLGARVFAVGSNVMICAGLALLGLGRDYTLVLVACFIMGLGAGTLDMVLSPIVAALCPHRRSSALNLLHSFYCIGAVATVLIGATALRHGISWRNVALGLGALPLIVGAGFTVAYVPVLVEGHQRTPVRRLLRRRYFQVAMGAILLAGATEMGMAQWLAAYAETGLHFSRWAGAMGLMAFSICMAAGRLGTGMLPHGRIDPIRLMMACCVLSTGAFAAACWAPQPQVALVGCVGVGLFGACLWPSMLAVSADRYPQGGASMFAMLAAAGNLGGIIMPWTVGWVADLAPGRALHWGLTVAAACPLMMAVCLQSMGSGGTAAAIEAAGAEAPALGTM